ncbi:hypothetical protein A4X06_0g4602 [Tilletia controversa]|uniref:FHA domain-containing protein n=1 Tax=Tilletia controversa TaxID=13291 RepID=A0A8X7MSH3_9BASI|nr:hypothetical protein A4X06_0g4602 [Tilletia controversa]
MRVGFEPTPFRTTGPAHIITHGSYFSLATSVPGSNNIRVNGHLLHNYTHTLRDGDRVEFGTAYHVGWDEKYDTDGDYQSWPTYSFVSGLSVQVHIAFPLGFDDRRVWTDLCADPVIYRSPTPPTTLILPSGAAPRTSPVLDPREDTKPEPQMDELRKAHTRQLERAARQDASATSSPQGNTSSPTHSLALTPLAIVTSPSSTGRKSPPVRVPYEDLLQSLRSRLTANATGQCPPIDVDTPPCMTFSSLKQVSDDSKESVSDIEHLLEAGLAHGDHADVVCDNNVEEIVHQSRPGDDKTSLAMMPAAPVPSSASTSALVPATPPCTSPSTLMLAPPVSTDDLQTHLQKHLRASSSVTLSTSASDCSSETRASSPSSTSVSTSVLGFPSNCLHSDRSSSSSRVIRPSRGCQNSNTTTAELAVRRMRAAWMEASSLVRSAMTTVDSVDIVLRRVRTELLRVRTIISGSSSSSSPLSASATLSSAPLPPETAPRCPPQHRQTTNAYVNTHLDSIQYHSSPTAPVQSRQAFYSSDGHGQAFRFGAPACFPFQHFYGPFGPLPLCISAASLASKFFAFLTSPHPYYSPVHL